LHDGLLLRVAGIVGMLISELEPRLKAIMRGVLSLSRTGAPQTRGRSRIRERSESRVVYYRLFTDTSFKTIEPGHASQFLHKRTIPKNRPVHRWIWNRAPRHQIRWGCL